MRITSGSRGSAVRRVRRWTSPSSALAALEHAGVEQRAQTGREHRARDARDTAVHLAETAAAAEQLAHDEQRPALTEQIEGAGHGAELAVGFHGRHHTPRTPATAVRISYHRRRSRAPTLPA